MNEAQLNQAQMQLDIAMANSIWNFAVANIENYPEAVSFVNERKIFPGQAGFISTKDFPLHSFEVTKQMFDRLKDVLYDRILFPLRVPSGVILGFASRALNVSGAKYLYHSISEVIPTQTLFYGMYQATQNLQNTVNLYVVEGITGAIAMQRVGITTIASLGANLTFEQAAILSSFAQNIVLAYDNDAAGISGTMQALKALASFEVRAKASFPIMSGLDPEDAINSGVDFYSLDDAVFFKHFLSEKEFNEYVNCFASEEIKKTLKGDWLTITK